MHLLFGQESFEAVLDLFKEWVFTYLISMNAVSQALATLAAFFVAYSISKPLQTWLKNHHLVKPQHEKLKESLSTFVVAISWTVIQSVIVAFSIEYAWPYHISRTVMSLLLVWIFAGFIASFIKDAVLSKVLAISAWVIAALYITGLLEPTIAVLSQVGLRMGDLRISILDLMWGAIVLLLMLWMANSASALFESRINQREDLEPTVKVLFSKLLRAFLMGSSLLLAISAVGIDISALAIFGGAVGLGVGFGLQKVISNLICGVILLMDRSIKPGDVIKLSGSSAYGTVNQLRARFVCIRTPAGEEHLIPNEEVITKGVENWSFSDRAIRLALPIRVSLDTDVRKAIQVLTDAAFGLKRVLAYPKPVARIKGFGEWAVEMELLVWINDPENGLSNIKSDLYLNVWDALKRERIEIPLPQRAIHVANPNLECGIVG